MNEIMPPKRFDIHLGRITWEWQVNHPLGLVIGKRNWSAHFLIIWELGMKRCLHGCKSEGRVPITLVRKSMDERSVIRAAPSEVMAKIFVIMLVRALFLALYWIVSQRHPTPTFPTLQCAICASKSIELPSFTTLSFPFFFLLLLLWIAFLRTLCSRWVRGGGRTNGRPRWAGG